MAANTPVQIKITGDAAGLESAVNQGKRSLGSLGSSAEQAGKSIAALASSLTAALGAGAITSSLISTQREFDKINTGLVTVTGSTAAASAAFGTLATLAAKTPFSLQEVSNAFVKLRTLGLQPTEAALTSYGNTASAMGKSLDQFVEAVADASTSEFERLKEFGIKAKVDGDRVSLTFRGLTTTIQNSSVAITQYLEDIGNIEFAGAMERQAQTLDGSLSNLEDAFAGLAPDAPVHLPTSSL
jgi:hypothetical protein